MVAVWCLVAVLRAGDPLHGENITIVELDPNRFDVTFSRPHASDIKSIGLAGPFNHWNPAAHQFKQAEPGGPWTFSMTLEGGVVPYKHVINGDQWQADPKNPLHEQDGFGANNSLLRLGPMARVTESRAQMGDSKLEANGLIHISNQPRFARSTPGGRLTLRLATLARDASSVALLTPADGKVLSADTPPSSLTWGPKPMTRVVSTPRFDYWEIVVDAPTEGIPLPYAFSVVDGSSTILLDAAGTTPRGTKPEHPFEREYDPGSVFNVPSWARDTVWYMALVDRFRNGSRENDPENTRPWDAPWKSPSPWEERDGATFYSYYVYDRVYGGDLQGLKEKLPYLQQLGVSGLYLLPVFESPAYHGYEVMDYRHISDRMGVTEITGAGAPEAAAASDLLNEASWKMTLSDKLFLEVVQEARKRGIRIVIDLVYNHSGNEHLAYRDLRANGQASKFAKWYNVLTWDPLETEGWGGFGKLPVFQEDEYGFVDDTLREHLMAVTRRWLDPNGDGDPSDGVDGYRLDASNEVSRAFWEEWRKEVKRVNPNALIIGELWGNPESYLDGRHFDITMNYQFAIASSKFFFDKKTASKPTVFADALAEQRLALPDDATAAMMNLIDSHDTDRVLSMIMNPDRSYDRGNRLQSDGPTYNVAPPTSEAIATLKLFLAFQMTYLGAPAIYYGTEIGMFGADDPNNRQPMVWDDQTMPDQTINTDVADTYKRLVAMRNTYDCLRRGNYIELIADDAQDVLAFARQGTKDAAVTVLNRSNQERVVRLNVGTMRDAVGPARSWIDVLSERDVTLLNFRPDGETTSRRGLKINKPVLMKPAGDGILEVKLAPRSARVLVTGTGS